MPTPTQPFRVLPCARCTADDRQRLARVADLNRRFARFRRENPRNTRIPKELRAAVVAAIAHGVAPGLLRRTCGISTSQLARWRPSACALVPAPATALASPSPLATPLPRVFSVVSETTSRPADLPATPPADALELRLGTWSVCVRRLEPTDAVRG